MRSVVHGCRMQFILFTVLMFFFGVCQSNALAYCASQGNSVSYEWIEGVQVGSFSRTSGSNGGYADYTGDTVALSGGATNVTLTPGFRSGTYTEYWRIWIDLNQDGLYGADELLYSGSSRYVINTTITIPETALSGQTGMRISMKYGGSPPACGSYTYGEVEDYTASLSVVDATPPLVSATTPAHNADDAAVNTAVTAVFSEPVDPASLTGDAFVLWDGAVEIPGALSYSGVSLTFTPDADLVYSTQYTATISTDVLDLAGNSMENDYVWSFTTDGPPDLTPPLVSATTPANGAADVTVNSSISATFSEPMNPGSIHGGVFHIHDGPTQIGGFLVCSGATATFTPSSDLDHGTTYTAAITTGAMDLAGNALTSDYIWTFTTGAYVDITPPTVLATSPYSNEVDAAANMAITVVFSEPMDPATITTVTFTAQDGSGSITGAVSSAGAGAAFGPTEPLAYETAYTATITTGAADLAGNHLTADYTWQFTTGEAPDLTPPVVSGTDPADLALDIPINTAISVTFSEVVDAATLTTASFTVNDGANDIPGAVVVMGATALFTPTAYLENSAVYTAQVAAGVTDLAGNALGADYTWSFTTGPYVDVLRPAVLSKAPVGSDVSVDAEVVITFTEPMDPASITTAVFTLQNGAGDVAGAVSLDGADATFTPDQPLDYETVYTATMTTGAMDLAGNHMQYDYYWQFTTEEAPDLTPPFVTAVDPVDLAVDVPVGATLSVTFSEEMDAATLTTATLIIDDGASDIPGTVSAAGDAATFTPDAALSYGAMYTATVAAGVADLAGNPLVSDYTWTFTTLESYTVSGQITLDGLGLSGVQLSLVGDASMSQTTGADGWFLFEDVEPGDYTLTPSLIGHIFTPESVGVQVVDADVPGADFTAVFIAVLHVPGEYATIQAAVDAAGSGATVLVADGLYNENINVDKSLTIVSENGYEYTSVAAVNLSDHIFQVNAPDVTIEGFDLYGATGYYRAGVYFGSGSHNGKAIDNRSGYDGAHWNYVGVYVYQSDNMEITGNTCNSTGLYGILVDGSNGSSFTNNTAEDHGFDGIHLDESSNNVVSGNTLVSNRSGILLMYSDNNTITDNISTWNEEHGIHLKKSSDQNTLSGNTCNSNTLDGILVDDLNENTVVGNSASYNEFSGIVVYSSDNVTVNDNTCTYNDSYGIYLYGSTNCTVSGNTSHVNDSAAVKLKSSTGNLVSGNSCNYSPTGIYLDQASGNTITRNIAHSKITYAYGRGVRCYYADGNTIYLNDFVNNQGGAVFSQSSTNIWSSPEEESYTYNGVAYTGYLGNYYSSHVLTDSDGDGVTDALFDLPDLEPDDNYPLAEPMEAFLLQ
ncbi:MAG: hypothetical protein GY859_35640 [Desulfobacterales bacterium]|nr:hypothetical protein [Desulfobacterales bacterium]